MKPTSLTPPVSTFKLRCLALALCGIGATMAQAAQSPAVEDRAARERLPEFKVIPAATRAERTPSDGGAPVPTADWPRSQGDAGSRRFSGLTQITADNVKSLELAWTYQTKDGAENVQCTPIVVGGVMYAPTPGRAVVAVNAATGAELWRFKLEMPRSLGLEDAPARRGLVYWPGDAKTEPRIYVGCGKWFYALDPKTGTPVATFGEAGRVAIPTGATASGVISGEVFVTCGLYGDVYGYDVRTGANLWRFHSIPKGKEFGAETWDGPQAGANGWSGLSLDEKRGIVYVALGAARPDMVGVDRLGDNLFSNCVVALEAKTGKRLWHFQDVRHDIWDLDVCAPPNLVTVQLDGAAVDAVTVVSKAGHLLLLDRVSGKPLFPFRLRRAPTSTVPGERTAEYQPDPELPEKISEAAFDPAQITDRTPEAKAFVEQQLRWAKYGFFEPPSLTAPLLYIGSRGGAEWSGASFDPRTNRLYVTSNRWVSKITLLSVDDRERDPRHPPSTGENHYKTYCAACHGQRREGFAMAPALLGLDLRLKDADVLALLQNGRGAMPPNHALNATQKAELLDYLFRRNQPPSRPARPGESKYVFDGFNFLIDHEGYPGIKPPWGLLNCYDLNTGKALWRVPLGELEELTRKGMPVTGSQNLGGATATAGGLVFVAGTEDKRLRAFSAETGKELWSATLPFAGSAAPALYEVGGRQYVVITATGGGRVGGPKGDAYVAFALRPTGGPKR